MLRRIDRGTGDIKELAIVEDLSFRVTGLVRVSEPHSL